MQAICNVQVKHMIGWIKHSPEESQKNDNFDEHLESLIQLNINYSLVAFISS